MATDQIRAPEAIELGPEEGWVPVHVFGSRDKHPSFVSGYPQSDRIRVIFYTAKDNTRLMAKVWFGSEAEGPPGHTHGGAMASVLDEMMGAACWAAGHTCVAAEIRIRFKKMLPLGQVLMGEAWVESVDGRKVRTVSRLFDPQGNVYSEGDGLFIALKAERLKELSSHAAQAPHHDSNQFLKGR